MYVMKDFFSFTDHFIVIEIFSDFKRYFYFKILIRYNTILYTGYFFRACVNFSLYVSGFSFYEPTLLGEIMKIKSTTGYFIIMDPHYLQLTDIQSIHSINFLKNPEQAAIKFEKLLFPDRSSDKIGLIILDDGPGTYNFDRNYVSFWDVEQMDIKKKSLFGVEFGYYIIFDIEYIQTIYADFDKFKFINADKEKYIEKLNKKIGKGKDVILWNQSHVGIGDGWHEINWQAFKKL